MSEHSQNKPGLPKPPHLTTLCSISCGMAAETFFGLAREAGVTAIADIRILREGPRSFWTFKRDIGYFCRLHGMEYLALEALMPTQELRRALHAVIDVKPVDKAAAAEAWTHYLEQYSGLIAERRYLDRGKGVRELVYGNHQTVAFMCTCSHHRDCHRSVALGHLSRWVDGLTVKELYPNGKAPSRDSHKVTLRDIPSARVLRDDDKRLARVTGRG